MKKIVYRLKIRVRDFKINFKKKPKEYNEKPKSKRKSFSIGFTTDVSILGLTLFAPAPTIRHNKKIINNSLSGLAASVCDLVVTSGSFANKMFSNFC